ncbi:hypothetical protein SAY87_015970 [Trapa incisa]|uniref:Secreted protein n=1 Tax=Trapa incisa TaxID=236973 RepID=A0AAN7L957_9MYRT|nr:hypothetical protein SAY87_015970 [Trapa incisa]
MLTMLVVLFCMTCGLYEHDLCYLPHPSASSLICYFCNSCMSSSSSASQRIIGDWLLLLFIPSTDLRLVVLEQRLFISGCSYCRIYGKKTKSTSLQFCIF